MTASKTSPRNGSAMYTTVTSSGITYSIASPVWISTSLQRNRLRPRATVSLATAVNCGTTSSPITRRKS